MSDQTLCRARGVGVNTYVHTYCGPRVRPHGTYLTLPTPYSTCVVHLVDAHPKHLQSVADLTEMSLAAWLRGCRPA